jgi:hypothetical protein
VTSKHAALAPLSRSIQNDSLESRRDLLSPAPSPGSICTLAIEIFAMKESDSRWGEQSY